jgi:hypothetical protein
MSTLWPKIAGVCSTAKLLGRRRTVRHVCRWNVEVTDVESETSVAGVTRDVGLFGLFVETATPFAVGRTIQLNITKEGRTFDVPGVVSRVIAGEGMGVAFGAITPEAYHVLRGWLAEDSQSQTQRPANQSA